MVITRSAGERHPLMEMWNCEIRLAAALDTKRREIRGFLRVAPKLVGQFFPTVADFLGSVRRGDFTCHEARQYIVENDLLVLLIVGNTQVEHHVRAVQAVLNRAEVILGRRFTETSRFP